MIDRSSRARWWIGLLGAGAVVAFVLILGGWTGPNRAYAGWDALRILATSGPLALIWVTAAIGLGWPVRVLLAARAETAWVMQISLGVGMLLMLDAALGSLGMLQLGGSAGAWVVLVVGNALLIASIMRARARSPKSPPGVSRGLRSDLLLFIASPAIATLLIAACSAPGWLWASEFGGYDAMSYHLQLPKEWLSLGGGRIEPLQHNVYSFLPGYVEAAYYHLMVITGDALSAVYACQLLHAMLTLVTAYIILCVCGRWQHAGWANDADSTQRGWAGVAAAAVFLGTPWTIIVGSLGYNEAATTLMLAAGLLAIIDSSIEARSRAIIIGLLAGAACGAKLTSVGFVALPLAGVMLWCIPVKRWFTIILLSGLAGTVILIPYLVRNSVFVGNPVFPFATSLFGLGHWSAEQVSTWNMGHAADAGLVDRLLDLWNQFFRYGFGTNPEVSEPWKPQWSVLPWVGVVSLVVGWSWSTRVNKGLPATDADRRSRSIIKMLAAGSLGILVVQLLFWVFFTHLKSRFLLPAAVPLSIGAGLAIWTMCASFASKAGFLQRAIQFSVMPVAFLWSVQPMLIYRMEAGHQPAAAMGLARTFAGDDLSREEVFEFGRTTYPTIMVNHVLPEGSRVLLIGEAAPLYFHADRIIYQTTWDRGVLSTIMRDFPNDPVRWRIELRRLGFTHVLIDPSMLQRWERAGWNDPLLTAKRVMDAFARAGASRTDYPNGQVLVEFAP